MVGHARIRNAEVRGYGLERFGTDPQQFLKRLLARTHEVSGQKHHPRPRAFVQGRTYQSPDQNLSLPATSTSTEEPPD